MIRDTVTNNDLGFIPTIPIFVGFTINGVPVPFPLENIPTFLNRIFGPAPSMNAYYKEISYKVDGVMTPFNIELVQEPELTVCVDNSPDHYAWGYLPSEFVNEKPKELTIDVFEKVLASYPSTDFQDKLVLLILGATSGELGGRGAMGLVPGVCIYPEQAYPEDQELFVGFSPRSAPRPENPKEAYFIDLSYRFDQYYRERSKQFDSYNDRFIRGACIFCTDAVLSCAAHDVIHALKRISAGLPTTDFPGCRARATPCLYNLYMQGDWLSRECDRRFYCTPYIGWWDNTGDHFHPKPPREFFSSTPYGVSSFTKMKLGLIPPEYFPTMSAQQQTFKLAPLAVRYLPAQTNGMPVLAVKVPLSEDSPPTEYLLVEYKYPVEGSVDDVQVDVCTLLGNCALDPNKVNPPDHLVSTDGLLIYHVNEEKRHFGDEPPKCDNPTGSSTFVRDFILYLYMPSMMTETGALRWDTYRTPGYLKFAAFRPNQNPLIPEFRLAYPLDAPTTLIKVNILGMDKNYALIGVAKDPI